MRLLSLLNSSIFTIEIGGVDDGERQGVYHIHEDILTSQSGYFKRMLGGVFDSIETNSRCVRLDSSVDREDAFDVVARWLYSGRYEVPPAISTIGSEACLLHARVYVLAEKLLMQSLKTAALEHMRTDIVYDDVPDGVFTELVAIIYSFTPALEIHTTTAEEAVIKPEPPEPSQQSTFLPPTIPVSDRQPRRRLPKLKAAEMSGGTEFVGQSQVQNPEPSSPQKEAMRQLMAEEGANRIETLRSTPSYAQMALDHPEFMIDLVSVFNFTYDYQ